MRSDRRLSIVLSLSLVAATLGSAASVHAADNAPVPAAKPPTTAAAPQPGTTQTTSAQTASATVDAAPAAGNTSPLPPASSELVPLPGGLTGELVGKRAANTNYNARAAEEQLRAAAARVDQSWAAFLPRLTFNAQYTRVSEFTPPSLGAGSLVGTLAAPGTINPSPTAAVAFAFPVILNQWALQAQIVVPLSDYFLRINQGYTVATQAADAARYDIESAKARAATEAIYGFYGHIRARGSLKVAEQALQDVRNHATDAQNQFRVGNASKADVLRAETQVASAELTVVRMKNLVVLTEKQVRMAIHAKDGELLYLGEDLTKPPTPPEGELKSFIAQAMLARPEVKSLEANLNALKKQASIARASAYPRVSAFGEATYANPNQRRVPQADEWFPTWSLGVQATWSPNDIASALPAGRDVEAKAAALTAQKQSLLEGVELEVTQALQAFAESQVAIETTARQLTTAEEAYRVAHELFINGRATSTLVTDAETELTRARLESLSSKIEAFISRARLDHMLGKDVKYASAKDGE